MKRSTKRPSPTPLEIRLARVGAGLTQQASADLLDVALRTWQDWEYGRRAMHPQWWQTWDVKVRRAKRSAAVIQGRERAHAG